MEITLNIPDALAAHLQATGKDPAQAALEAIALEGYRAEQLSESQIRQMLGYETRMEVHAFLKDHGVYLNYSTTDVDQDDETIRYLRSVRRQAQSQPAA